MRIGIDGGSLANRRGFGRFARHALDALARAESPHEFVVLLDEPSADAVVIPDRFERRLVPLREAPSRSASSHSRRRLADLLRMGAAAARETLDLLYFPTSYSFFPVWNVPRVVVTVHDALPLAHPELVFPGGRGRWAWRLKEWAAVRRADRIVTVSQASRRDLIAWHRLDPAAIRVVPEGPGEAFQHRPPGPESDAVLRRYGIPPSDRFLLYVGGLSPHKNLLRLIDAYAKAKILDVPLILVGDFDDPFHTHAPELRAAIRRQGLDASVRFTGFVTDDDLAHLYSRSYALVFPSLLEGFGLPAVEAMACGTPVLHSRTGSLPEVVGNAGASFDPEDVDEISSVLSTFLASPTLRDRAAAAATARSHAYSWDAAARGLLACFDEFGPRAPRRTTFLPFRRDGRPGSPRRRGLRPTPARSPEPTRQPEHH